MVELVSKSVPRDHSSKCSYSCWFHVFLDSFHDLRLIWPYILAGAPFMALFRYRSLLLLLPDSRWYRRKIGEKNRHVFCFGWIDGPWTWCYHLPLHDGSPCSLYELRSKPLDYHHDTLWICCILVIYLWKEIHRSAQSWSWKIWCLRKPLFGHFHVGFDRCLRKDNVDKRNRQYQRLPSQC